MLRPSVAVATLITAALASACRPYTPPTTPDVDTTTLASGGGDGGCTPASNAALCLALGVSCGPAEGADNCGKQRTVTSCGGCAGDAACRNGQCVRCAGETDATFCERTLATCGEVTGIDNCDRPRTVASCGNCSDGEECDVENYCRCAPESDEAMCSRLQTSCGRLVRDDNCGEPRSVESCGRCADGTFCVAGSCCVPETDTELCAARSGLCGPANVRDRCGQPRALAGCSCDSAMLPLVLQGKMKDFGSVPT
jgi:hypothetical protein